MNFNYCRNWKVKHKAQIKFVIFTVDMDTLRGFSRVYSSLRRLMGLVLRVIPQQAKWVNVNMFLENSLEMLTFHKELKIEEINSTNTGE